jgi:hypothetical protein
MKRRQVLKVIALPLLLASSCKEELPDVPTLVTGQVIDENGQPLEGAGLRLTGVDNRGWSGVPTFSITTETDSDGAYRFSQVVPKNSDDVRIIPESNQKVNFNADYDAFILIQGSYTQVTSPHFIPRSDWGKTTILNYQFKKL